MARQGDGAARDGQRAQLLIERAQQTGDLGALKQAIALLHRALGITSRGDPDYALYLSNLGAAWHTRFRIRGDMADLDQAIDAMRAALEASRDQACDRATDLSNLCDALRIRSELLGDEGDLAAAIQAGREALRAAPETDPGRMYYLNSLAGVLLVRYRESKKTTDLGEAIDLVRAAILATPADHPERPAYLSNLAVALHDRYSETGDLSDLSESVRAHREAVAATAPGHPERARHLATLGRAMRRLYEYTSNPADLGEAVKALRDAVQATPAGHALRADYLCGLARALIDKSAEDGLRSRRALHARVVAGEPVRLRRSQMETPSRWEKTPDLDEAISALRISVKATAPGNPARVIYQSALGVALRIRSERTGSRADIGEAIRLGQAVTRAVPDGHPRRAGFEYYLGIALRISSEREKDAAGLDQAASLFQRVLSRIPVGDPRRAGCLYELGEAQRARFELTGDVTMRAEAFSAWREAAGEPYVSALAQLMAAVSWGKLAAVNGVAEQAEAGFTAAIALLPLVMGPGASQHGRLEAVSLWAGLPGDAAGCAINAGNPQRAVELLERGRAVYWTSVLGLRGELTGLRREYPQLARRLERLRAALDQYDAAADDWRADSSDGRKPRPDPLAADSLRQRAEARITQAAEWQQLIREIRAQPGFSAFLQVPPAVDLAPISTGGTVVIVNVSRFRCDALAVSASGVRLIPLPGLTAEATGVNARRYQRAIGQLTDGPDARRGAAPDAQARQEVTGVLAWLWDTAAAPVLEALGCVEPPANGATDWPRLWWCPTGLLSVLPWHAAGRYDAGPSGRSVLDRVISSYATTLGSLRRARDTPAPDPNRRPTLLLVTMPTTPGAPPLPGVTKEARVVVERFDGPCTQRSGDRATRAGVLADVPGHAYAHFALSRRN